MNRGLIVYHREELDKWVKKRRGETRLGEKIRCLEKETDLDELVSLYRDGVRFALLGIPESIGVRANSGGGGAERAWSVFLEFFLNMQSNRYVAGETIACLGHVDTVGLNQRAAGIDPAAPDGIIALRDLCRELDDLVYPIIAKISKSGLIPVVIGGGHNNAYPILKGVAAGTDRDKGLDCVNLDPHADFRPMEGRHSGNGFTYAFDRGYLGRYFILGLHTEYNNEAMLDKIENEPQIGFTRYRPGRPIQTQMESVYGFFQNPSVPVGLELDSDSIAGMPASAMTPSGWRVDEARQFVRGMASRLKPAYFHVSEAAPGDNLPERILVGKTLAHLVLDFVETRGMKQL